MVSSREANMGKMVPATEFKAKCLALIEEMQRSGEPLTITRRGKPAITLTAQREEAAPRPSILGIMKGTVSWAPGFDPTDPVDPDWEAKWEAKWDERGFPVRSDDQRR
jgi:prevent-host-death family protein